MSAQAEQEPSTTPAGVQPGVTYVPDNSNVVSRQVSKISPQTWSVVMRVVSIMDAMLLISACVLAFIGNLAPGEDSDGDRREGSAAVSSVFLSLYIGLFGLLLLVFETRSKMIGSEKWIRRTFGFMFTYWGRTCFLIFVGCLNIGLSDSGGDADGGLTEVAEDVVIAAAVITVLNAFFHCVILCSHPGFQNMQEKTTNPKELNEDQVKAYLAEHPELAAQAAQGFQTESSQPPPVAADFGSGSAQSSSSPTSKTQGGEGNPFGDDASGQTASRPPAAPEATTSKSNNTSSEKGNKKNKKNKGKKNKKGNADTSANKSTEDPFVDDNPFA